jgi:hypothetical protein
MIAFIFKTESFQLEFRENLCGMWFDLINFRVIEFNRSKKDKKTYSRYSIISVLNALSAFHLHSIIYSNNAKFEIVTNLSIYKKLYHFYKLKSTGIQFEYIEHETTL